MKVTGIGNSITINAQAKSAGGFAAGAFGLARIGRMFFCAWSVFCLVAAITPLLAAPPPAKVAIRVTASSSASSHAPEMAFDGNLSSRWASAPFRSESEWLEIDFGKRLPVRTVILHWEAAYAAHYQLQVSDAEHTWNTQPLSRVLLPRNATCE